MKTTRALVAGFAFSIIALMGCGGDDGSPTDDGGGNGNGSGTELLQSAENLWTVTAANTFHYCATCDAYTLVWQTGGWSLTATFADWGSTCYGQNCGTMQTPFVYRQLTVTPHFNVSAYSTVKLRWTEELKDFSGINALVSPDGGSTWTLVSNTNHTANTSSETAQEVEITQYLGSALSDVRLRFEFVAGTNQFPRRLTGNATYTCRSAIKNVTLVGFD